MKNFSEKNSFREPKASARLISIYQILMFLADFRALLKFVVTSTIVIVLFWSYLWFFSDYVISFHKFFFLFFCLFVFIFLLLPCVLTLFFRSNVSVLENGFTIDENEYLHKHIAQAFFIKDRDFLILCFYYSQSKNSFMVVIDDRSAAGKLMIENLDELSTCIDVFEANWSRRFEVVKLVSKTLKPQRTKGVRLD